jgi:hypothetical protein
MKPRPRAAACIIALFVSVSAGAFNLCNWLGDWDSELTHYGYFVERPYFREMRDYFALNCLLKL